MTRRTFTAADRKKIDPERRRARRAARLEAIGQSVDLYVRLFNGERDKLPRWALRAADGARRGAWRSLVVLGCGHCTAWQAGEIRRCSEHHCPWHALRPFQGKAAARAE